MNRPYTTNGLNQYTAAGSANFQYDGNGNLISDGARAYLYDIENRLVQVTGASSGYIVYDPLGRIFEYTGGGGITHQFLYDGDALVAEYSVNGGGVLLRRYVHSVGADVPVLWYEGAGLSDPRYLYGDHQGSIVAVVGGSVSINRYDEYGIPQGTISGRFAYTGQIYLPEIGLYHYKARVSRRRWAGSCRSIRSATTTRSISTPMWGTIRSIVKTRKARGVTATLRPANAACGRSRKRRRDVGAKPIPRSAGS